MSIEPRAPVPQPRERAELARQLPEGLRFVAAFLSPPPPPTPGLRAISETRVASERAATATDAARVLPEGLSSPSPAALIGAGVAGAAMALRPTFVAKGKGTTIRVNPRIWPPGINIQGEFF